jgi:hypothetical protein
MGVANDGNAVIWTNGPDGTAATTLFYSTVTGEITPGASGLSSLPLLVNGPRGSRVGGWRTLSDAVLEYDAADGILRTRVLSLFGSSGSGLPAPGFGQVSYLDRIFDRNYRELGQLAPGTLAVILTGDATLAWAVEHDFGLSTTIRRYDTTTNPASGDYDELPPALTAAFVGGGLGQYQRQLTADERTLFVAGNQGVIVQPLPAP